LFLWWATHCGDFGSVYLDTSITSSDCDENDERFNYLAQQPLKEKAIAAISQQYLLDYNGFLLLKNCSAFTQGLS
jgi:hypothetical protein